ncbi:hypothetical protein B0H15DRAFT_528138 [Mycena belliarum]|uniref:F-box domain-containing protein n=1 Tax=Mycena belliarum TaxID=1033014 RepID=A0AAD6TTD2_9AGAR|nr:hypothetical protein B0H15DRAFT_528138 [Mycena belliae]
MALAKFGFRSCVAWFSDLVQRRASIDTDADDSTLVDYDAVCHIKRLPDPVLDKIFTHSKCDVQYAPVERVVSQVASRWRTVSLGNPELWATIDVRGHAEKQRALLQWYLNNSAGCPLDVRLALSQESWSAGVLEDILNEAPRLRSLSIRADFEGAEAAVRALCKSVCAPHLEHLTFIFLEQPPPILDLVLEADFSPVVFTGGVPQLSVVRLQHVERVLFPPLTGVTTLHLEEYTCPPMAYNCFCALLRALPVLANLSVYGNAVEAWPASPALRLPCLRSLRVSSNEEAGRMLLAFDTPALTSLFLKNVRDIALVALWNGVSHAQQLHFPALQTLSLDGPCGAQTLSAIYREFPGITELRLVNCDADLALDLLRHASDLPRSIMVHRIRDTAVLDELLGRGIALQVHCDVSGVRDGVTRWERLAPWPAELARPDADDLFMQLGTYRA